jgi:hypothetical protein
MRITVGDVLSWLAEGVSHEQILSDYPELTEEDIRAFWHLQPIGSPAQSSSRNEAFVRPESESQALAIDSPMFFLTASGCGKPICN